MKEFWLDILKKIITYVAMIVIVIVGGISISNQKFPPKWSEIVSAVNTLKNGYVSMLNLRQQLGGMMNAQQGLNNQIPDLSAIESNAALSLEKHTMGAAKKPDAEMQMTLALVQAMGKQMPTHQDSPSIAFDPDFKKNLETIQKQNENLIERMDKIQQYLAGLHQYLTEARRQPSAVSQPVQPRVGYQPKAAPKQPSTVPQQTIKK
jgi:hypothetical protein